MIEGKVSLHSFDCIIPVLNLCKHMNNRRFACYVYIIYHKQYLHKIGMIKDIFFYRYFHFNDSCNLRKICGISVRNCFTSTIFSNPKIYRVLQYLSP